MKHSLVKKPRQQKSRSPKPIADLLLEIGAEELPYEFVAPTLTAIRESANRVFQDARLSFGSVSAYGTPRRLVLVVDDLLAHQTEVVKETMGPSRMVAFDQTGQPTKAAMGFAAGQGVTVDNLVIRETPKGEYLFAVKREAGRPTATLLLESLPQLVESISFPKAMKWNETGLTLREARTMDCRTVRGKSRAGTDSRHQSRQPYVRSSSDGWRKAHRSEGFQDVQPRT